MKSSALNVFMQMANQYDILDPKNLPTNEPVKRVEDSFVEGFQKLQKGFMVDPYLSQFKEHLFFNAASADDPDGNDQPEQDADKPLIHL